MALKGHIPWNKGIPHSKNTKEKMSKIRKGKIPSNKGAKHSSEAKQKMREAKKDFVPWNKGLKGFLEGHIGFMLGKKHSEKAKHKISKSRIGELNPRWKGGITSLTILIRTHYKYRQWRSDVFTRDNFTCQVCSDNKSGKLNAHHIKSFTKIFQQYQITNLQEALDCEEFWNINNGITLCEKCHREIY